jgi:hypothetical protein
MSYNLAIVAIIVLRGTTIYTKASSSQILIFCHNATYHSFILIYRELLTLREEFSYNKQRSNEVNFRKAKNINSFYINNVLAHARAMNFSKILASN